MASLYLCEISQLWDRGNNDYLIDLWGWNIKTTSIITNYIILLLIIIVTIDFPSLRQ